MGGDKARGFLLGVGATVIAGALVVPVLALRHRSELPLERAVGESAVAAVARLGAGSAENPFGSGPRSTEAGRTGYNGSCAICHGANGDGRGVFGPDTYPPATDLTADAVRGRTDAELFWIIKNGLGFTAMPAFGRQYVDLDIWALVSYVRALQDRTADAAAASPRPSAGDLLAADIAGPASGRGAAVYFAQGCAGCHGPRGDAPGELALGARLDARSVREGGRGMPRYPVERLSDAELTDLSAYVATFARPGASIGATADRAVIP